MATLVGIRYFIEHISLLEQEQCWVTKPTNITQKVTLYLRDRMNGHNNLNSDGRSCS